MRPSSTIIVLSLVLLGAAPALAQERDEPGTPALADEPRFTGTSAAEIEAVVSAMTPSLPRFRVELAFGLSSLVVDPDMEQGYGGGLYVAYGLHRRVGVELSLFVGNNPYKGELGKYGVSFLAGNISLGPVVQLTRPGSRFSVAFEPGIGAYMVRPVLQDSVWSFGLSFGLDASLRLTRWMGIGVKIRYHLFNLGRLSGPELKDLKALQTVGVIDRLEIPAYLAFYF